MTDQAKPLRADARRNRAKVLAAAEQVFAEFGASVSTEQVAARAGVAIGTVFRHFPTKQELLRALLRELLARRTEELTTLVAEGDPATALFEFFTRLVAEAAANKAVVDLLAEAGMDVQVAEQVRSFQHALAQLLDRAKLAGAVRADVRLDEVLALLGAISQGALLGSWDRDLQTRTLAIVFTGLLPGG
ncbi:TetR/AcrR family transcriptional regulator [Kutzneria viridogrisea]|uniref:AcrR family transcriptional regulator n=1 Tax=Kutzneria viridogrisea TaxID=47990 RepID=A0ABR6BJP5_9PSEU|nr:AcrR family transcriptional regulator [Kutzneria viridogrisea]